MPVCPKCENELIRRRDCWECVPCKRQYGPSYFDGAPVVYTRPCASTPVRRLPRISPPWLRCVLEHFSVGEEFTVADAEQAIQDAGLRNYPSSVGIGQVFRCHPERVEKVRRESTRDTYDRRIVTVWRRVA
jgi:hypothetical protein